MRWMVRLLLATMLGACSGPSFLAVDLRTDLTPGLEFDRLRVQLLDLDDGVSLERTRDADASSDYAAGIRVAEFDGISDGSYDVRISFFDARGPLLEQTLRVIVAGDSVVTVLITRDCRDVVCPGTGDAASARFCLDGMCVDCDDGNCTSDECTVASDCIEQGACAVRSCESGACFYSPVHSNCTGAELCNPGEGCQRLPSETDGGMDASVGIDAGPPDACVPRVEVCNGMDDDCDGTPDNVEGLDTDVLNCGACGEDCASEGGTPSCVAGNCSLLCDEDLEDCDLTPGCETLLTSPETCGECDVVCGGGTPLCVPDGEGGYECGSSCDFAICSMDCVDTATDPSNCGDCGVTCDAGESCEAGACSCGGSGADCAGTPASTCCGTSCIDTTTSGSNCGACGATCDPGESCRASLCRCGDSTLDCLGTPASTCCGSACVDVTSSGSNCGGCGVTCDSGESCRASACHCGVTGPDCAGTIADTCCGTTCIDTAADGMNCGACGATCGMGEECTAGRCDCGSMLGTPGDGTYCGEEAACIDGACCCGITCEASGPACPGQVCCPDGSCSGGMCPMM